MNGTVKSYNYKRGYGFITAENGEEFFVHQTQIKKDGFRFLRRGQKVSFDPVTDNGRTAATNVCILSED